MDLEKWNKKHISASLGYDITSMTEDPSLLTYLVVCIKLVKTLCMRKQKHRHEFMTQQDLDGTIYKSVLRSVKTCRLGHSLISLYFLSFVFCGG